jgi:chloramphenicol 3-O phosphotransferase
MNVVIFGGPPASGKSTISRRLQTELSRAGELWVVLNFDLFALSMPRAWFSAGKHQGQFAEKGYSFRQTDNGTTRSSGVDARRLHAAFHRSVAAVAHSGLNVICETTVLDEADHADWVAALSGLSVFWIGLHAPLAVLEARERADATRAVQGLARGMAREDVWAPEYDVEIDTSLEELEAVVRRLAARVKRQSAA